MHEFVRADVFTSMDDAVEFTIRKAKLIIDQNGASLFPENDGGFFCWTLRFRWLLRPIVFRGHEVAPMNRRDVDR